MAQLLVGLGLGLVVLTPPPSRAAESAGTQSPLLLGAGGRAWAMGRTGAASADDASALFWNPARLGYGQWPELQLFRTQLFDDGIAYHAGFLSYPTVDSGTFALGYQRLGVDAVDARDASNFQLGDFSASESHLLLGYGRRFDSGLAVGLTSRLAQQSIDSAAATGFGLDLGAAYERSLSVDADHRVSVGVDLQNALEPTLRLDSEDVSDPRSLKLGIAYRGAPRSSRLSWALAADLDLPREADPRVGLGAELALDRLLMLRVGSDDGRLTTGFALGAHGFTVEYAMLDGGDLSRNDRFALRWTFGRSTEQRRQQRLLDRESEVQQQLGDLLGQREDAAMKEALASADAAFDQGHFAQAREFYRRVLLVEPDHAHSLDRVQTCERELLLADADQARAREDFPVAANGYRQVLAQWPGDPRATAGLAQVRAILQASADHTEQADALFRHALGLFADGDLLGTRNSLDELLRLDPEHALGLELRARSEALRLDRGQALEDQARAQADAARYDEAIATLASARQLLPERSTDYDALRASWTQARDDAARQARISATNSVPTPPVPRASRPRPITARERDELRQIFQAGLTDFQAGRFDRAISQWQSIWDRRPGFEQVGDYLVKANLLQGIQLYSQGDYAGALGRCRRVLEIDPDNEKAQRYLARIREEQQELQQLRGE